MIALASHAKSDVKLSENDKITFGSRHLKVIATPGHTAVSEMWLEYCKLLVNDDFLRVASPLCWTILPPYSLAMPYLSGDAAGLTSRFDLSC